MKVNNISLREFRVEDAEVISKIIRTNLIQVNSRDYSESVISNMYGIFTPSFIIEVSEKRKMYVALDGEKIVGTASIEGDTIYTVFVDTEYHGKGIGRKLMECLEEIAANSGLQSVKLPASITAKKFYERLGYYALYEVETEEYGRDIIMEKSLV